MVKVYEETASVENKDKGFSELLKSHLSSIETLSVKLKEEIANVIASGTSATDDDEKSILLDLSNEIAAARNSEGLFLAVHSKLATFFDIEGLTIVLNEPIVDRYHLYGFEKGSSIPDQRELIFNETTLFDSRLNSMLKELTGTGAPLYYDTAAYADDQTDSSLFKSWDEKGWKNFAVVALKVSGENLGYLILHMMPDAISSLRINLLQGICAQLSVGLSNINRIEEILRRKNEMELLLSINTGIASVRSAEELATFIKEKFKKFLGCSHTMIAVIDSDGETFSPFLLDESARAKAHPDVFKAHKSSYKTNDPILTESKLSASPVLFDLVALELLSEMPLYIKLNHDLQQKTLLVTRLAKGDDVFGYWLIYFSDQELITNEKLQLIQSLSHQLCITVANIIANEEIESREVEKGRLLKFSNAIAPLRDKQLLSKVLKVQLYEIFGIRQYVIHVFNRETDEYRAFLFDSDILSGDVPDLNENLISTINYPKGLVELVSGSDGPILYEVTEENIVLPADSQSLFKCPHNQRVGMLIKLGSDGNAVLTFIHSDFIQVKNQEVLLKSICSQISIAVSNILANDKVNQQLLEIDRYKQQLEEETIYLKEEIEVNQNYAEIIGESQVMQKTFRMVTQVAPSDSTVLILGETGTGKELIARAIHNNSPRKNKLMVKVNCAALPANLIESELFGHEKGSFTGATERRLGKFEIANNGTLFLDEIGEMPLELQVKLLRALQEKEIERVGGRGTIKVDVRIIAATNRDLEKEVDEGRFRSDLYYRLNIFPIELAALRDRKEDIPILATHFIHRYSKKTGRQITTLGNKALQDMVHYSWPGNIRELEHLIERSILLTTGPTLKHIHLPSNKTSNTVITSNGEISLKTIDENECEHILRILKYCQGRISGPGGAAEILGVPPSTLNSKIKRLGIKKEHLI